MKMLKVGDSSKAICSRCAQVRPVTFSERDVPLSSGKGTVREVLVGVCDVCDDIVSIPQQSVPRIKESLSAPLYALETRIPRHLLDVLGLACHTLGFDVQSSSALFRYYLLHSSTTLKLRSHIGRLAASDEAQGKANARFSAKLTSHMHKRLQLIETDGISKSDAVKGIIVKIKKDVLDDSGRSVRTKLQEVLELVG